MLLVLILFPRGVAGLCYDGRDRLVAALVRRHRRGGAGPPDRRAAPVDPALAP